MLKLVKKKGNIYELYVCERALSRAFGLLVVCAMQREVHQLRSLKMLSSAAAATATAKKQTQ